MSVSRWERAARETSPDRAISRKVSCKVLSGLCAVLMGIQSARVPCRAIISFRQPPYTTKREILRCVLRFSPLISADQHVLSGQRLRVLCDHQTLNTERTEGLRDLSVEPLETRRGQRTSHGCAPRSRKIITLNGADNLNGLLTASGITVYCCRASGVWVWKLESGGQVALTCSERCEGTPYPPRRTPQGTAYWVPTVMTVLGILVPTPKAWAQG